MGRRGRYRDEYYSSSSDCDDPILVERERKYRDKYIRTKSRERQPKRRESIENIIINNRLNVPGGFPEARPRSSSTSGQPQPIIMVPQANNERSHSRSHSRDREREREMERLRRELDRLKARDDDYKSNKSWKEGREYERQREREREAEERADRERWEREKEKEDRIEEERARKLKDAKEKWQAEQEKADREAKRKQEEYKRLLEEQEREAEQRRADYKREVDEQKRKDDEKRAKYLKEAAEKAKAEAEEKKRIAEEARLAEEKKEREREEEEKRIIREHEEKEKEKKQKDKELRERILAEEAERKRKEEEQKKKDEEDFEAKIRARAIESGWSKSYADDLLDSIKGKHRQRSRSPAGSSTSLVVIDKKEQYIDMERPTWIRIHCKHILPETLNAYRLRWDYDPEDGDYIIIKEYVDHDLQRELFAHTKKIIKSRKTITDGYTKETTLKPHTNVVKGKDQMYLVRRKSKSPAPDRRRLSFIV